MARSAWFSVGRGFLRPAPLEKAPVHCGASVECQSQGSALLGQIGSRLGAMLAISFGTGAVQR